MKKPAARFVLPAIALALLLMLPSAAAARAGGGQNYGEDGWSGGGGEGGGGDGLGYLFLWLIQLAFRQPLIGIPLLLAGVIVVSRIGKAAGTGNQYRTIERAGREAGARRQADVAGRLDAISKRDPAFDQALFLRRIHKGFLEVQAAWSAQDFTAVSRFLSDGVRERFTMQAEMLREEGIRNVIEDVSIQSSSIVAVESDDFFDTIHVEISARGKDSDLDFSTGRVIRGGANSPFTEYWSFLRRPGAVTPATGGLIEGSCPNCGAPLSISDRGKCENCDSIVSSGEYDWVLAEITQSSEWGTAADPSIIPGYSDMVSRDPAFNLQHIEDRASVIFWRFIRAHFEGSPDPLRKVSLPSFIPSFEESLRFSNEDGWWLLFKDAAVGAVEVQSIETAGSDPDAQDHIEVLIRWSARNARRNSAGRIRNAGDRTIRPIVYHLVRNRSVVTSRERAFLSSHCQACGAPYTGGESGNCDYCGRVLNDGSQDWVLASTGRYDASKMRPASVDAFARSSLIPPEMLLGAMAGAMFADGAIDPSEEKLLADFAKSRGISPRTVSEITASVRAGEKTLPVPSTREETVEILGAMARMILADGRMSNEEIELLSSFGEASGLTRADVMLIVSGQREQLFRQARRILENGR